MPGGGRSRRGRAASVDVVTALAWVGRSRVPERRGRIGCGVGSSAAGLLETGPQLPDPLVHRKLADEAGQHDLAPDWSIATGTWSNKVLTAGRSGAEDRAVVVTDRAVGRARLHEQEARWTQLFVLLFGQEPLRRLHHGLGLVLVLVVLVVLAGGDEPVLQDLVEILFDVVVGDEFVVVVVLVVIGALLALRPWCLDDRLSSSSSTTTSSSSTSSAGRSSSSSISISSSRSISVRPRGPPRSRSPRQLRSR